MLLKLVGDYDKSFLNNYIPRKIYYQWVMANANGRYQKLDGYFQKTIDKNLTTLGILKFALNNSKIIVEEDGISLDIFLNISYMGHLLKNLLQLIEYGSIEVKGTYTISKAFNQVKYYRDNYYKMYMGF